MREVVFVEVARSAFGRRGGSLKTLLPVDLAGLVIKGLVEKSSILERGKVDSLICGGAFGTVNSWAPARYACQAGGLPFDTSASWVEMQCGSAIDSINHAAWKIIAGAADVVIAGGFESHSQFFAKFSCSVEPYKSILPAAVPQSLSPFTEQDISMIQVSDGMARKWGVTREECDEFAYQSQMRAYEAQSKGYFKDEIIPIIIKGGKNKPDIIVDTDEHLRPETTMEGLARLKPVLGPDGFTTAGNASGTNDGAAFVLMMSADKAKELGYEPIARWVCGADYGVEPRYMGIGPAYSNLLALKRAGLTVKDLDVIECNEAFAAQNVSVIKEMESQIGYTIDRSKWNPNGGAIAFGHPNGASGARIGIFAMKELERTGGRYGLFGACCGGGHGVTTLIENLQR
ncbi:MAG: thiolase family protein [Oscillibacter sp.]|nr:thiolase family protein [Oscillibacter sp.]